MITLLPPDPEAEALEKQRHREREAVARILGDVYERESSLNREKATFVNYTDDELQDAAKFMHRMLMEEL